ncbi:hypothetical protein [Streptomyces sp. NPDC060333]|uniref:hypothetical protein n=1 Tax=Streptomyces sp. NPDC060333 TaxID=3347098 RepID=UPI00366837F5
MPSDRLAGALERLDGPAARLIVGLVAIHAVRAAEVARLDLADLDLARRTLAVRRGVSNPHGNQASPHASSGHLARIDAHLTGAPGPPYPHQPP